MDISRGSTGIAVLRGVQYFLIVFSFAFVTGVLRTLILAPRVGQTFAVLIEVPIIIAASWIAIRRLLRHQSFTSGQLILMGAIAFSLTMAGEAVLAALIRGQNVADWAASVLSPLGLIGLTAQIVFAAMPLLVGLKFADNVPR